MLPQAQNLEGTWEFLKEGIQQILQRLSEGLSYEKYINLYTAAYNYCTCTNTTVLGSRVYNEANRNAHILGSELYKKFYCEIKEHNTFLLEELQKYEGPQLIREYAKEWSKYTFAANILTRILSYLNRHWVKREIDEGRLAKDIYKLMLATWSETVFEGIYTKIIEAILYQIELMRNEEIIEAEPIKIFVDSCVEIGAKEAATEAQTLERYRFRFEQPLIKASKEYYDRESRTYMSTHTVVEYMSRAKYRIESEERRIKQVIHSTTLGLVMETIEVSYVSNHLEKMEAESMILLGNQQYDDLRNMYFLLTRVPTGLQVVRLMFLGYVKTKGLASVEQLQPEKDGSVDPSAYVGALFGVYETFADVCKTVFSQDSGLVASLDQACKEYINSNAVTNRPGPQSPELLTKYIDSLLKKGSKVSDDAELELKLNQVVTIFKYLEDKDSFQTFYRRSLAKRLVNELSTSFDAEQKIISKFKDVCGFDFTHKLARMFNDIELNNELNTQFRTKMTRSPPFDFSAKVFNTAAWPLTMAPYCANFIVPQALTEAVNGYTDFYTDRHKGRKLNWLWQFSKAEVKITLPNNTDPKRMTYMFSVSVFQLAIMQLLNSSPTRTITIQSILDSTKLPYNIIESSLSTFIKSRLVVILDPATKKPTDGTLSSSSLLKLNTAFRSKRLRINLNAPIKADQKKESLETSQAIADSRNILIQATIVRIMKTRKTLSHTMLVTETIAHLTSRFKPTILEIRKGIDTLLEKEFIERASGSKDQYNYLA